MSKSRRASSPGSNVPGIGYTDQEEARSGRRPRWDRRRRWKRHICMGPPGVNGFLQICCLGRLAWSRRCRPPLALDRYGTFKLLVQGPKALNRSFFRVPDARQHRWWVERRIQGRRRRIRQTAPATHSVYTCASRRLPARSAPSGASPGRRSTRSRRARRRRRPGGGESAAGSSSPLPKAPPSTAPP